MTVQSGEFTASNGIIVIKNGGTIAVGDNPSVVKEAAYRGGTINGQKFYTPDEWDALEEFFKTHSS